MKITMLGTGHALVSECYNSCFVISDENRYFMVDAGGGSGILRQLKLANFNWAEIQEIFVTHRHLDHVTGIFWMIRMICAAVQSGRYRGTTNIYACDEVIHLIHDMSERLLGAGQIKAAAKSLCFHEVKDGETRRIIGKNVTFFDTHSEKAKQFGFCMDLDPGGKITCCGDEPFQECEKPYVEGSQWLIHEAFCLKSQADRFKSYEHGHSTVQDACCLAQRLGIPNLILYHTEDSNLPMRKALYTKEGTAYYRGSLYVPNDLETIEL